MSEQVKLTEKQLLILNQLNAICRRNVARELAYSDYSRAELARKIALGDEALTFGYGGLTFQIARSIGVKSSAVLSVFKALERKALVIREKPRGYLCALYWWPVGLAEQLKLEGSKCHE